MIGLFSMFLSSAVDWGVKKVLDATTVCPTCAQQDALRIENGEINWVECSNCHIALEQFTNACDFTVDDQTGQIGHAILGPGPGRWKWTPSVRNGEWLGVKLNIRLQGLCERSVVLDTDLRRYHDDQLIVSRPSLLQVPYGDATWTNYSHEFEKSNFSSSANQCILAVDARLRSEYRDILFEGRLLIHPWDN